ncbi:helix-turn-helix domain-containing protein [Sphingomonas sp. PB2P19]|uniref:helix-turn-helix domain-containing protein n=1 Tax=Sphingomonas rhamnosi TaxID=3096156 RepID=UPI002FC9F21A
MTTFTLGEASARVLTRACKGRHALGGGESRGRSTRPGGLYRDGTTVLRGSIEAGTFEKTFFAVPLSGEPDRLLRACRRALDAGRRLRREAHAGMRTLTATERSIAALTGAAVRVYEEICTLARLNDGKVYPSYDWLAEATGLGRATIARALHVLERVGFLGRQRRFKRLEGEGPGPRYHQTSNVYRLLMPARVVNYLPRWMRPAPLPVDLLQHDQAQAETHAAMLASLSCRELAAVTIAGVLGEALTRLGAQIDRNLERLERESQNDPQSLRNSSELAQAVFANG